MYTQCACLYSLVVAVNIHVHVSVHMSQSIDLYIYSKCVRVCVCNYGIEPFLRVSKQTNSSFMLLYS